MNTTIDYSEINSRKFYSIISNNNQKTFEKYELEKPYLLLNNHENYNLENYKFEFVQKIFRNKEKKLAKLIFEDKKSLKENLSNFNLEDIFEYDLDLVHKAIVENKLKFFDKKPKILAFDIETESSVGFPDPKYDKILSISYYSEGFNKVSISKNYNSNHKYVSCFSSEEELLWDFMNTINEFNPDILCGYNSDRFDLKFILERLKKNNMNLKLGPLNSELVESRIGRENKISINGITTVDVYIFIRNVLSQSINSKSLKLNDVAEALLGDKKTDDLGAEIQKYYESNDNKKLDKICEYNLQDSKLTHDLLVKVLDIAIEFSNLVSMPIEKVTRMRYGRLVELFILKNAYLENRVIERKPTNDEVRTRMYTKYEGAFVYQPKPGLYENVRVFDFRSLYPSIIIAHNIEPDNLSYSSGKNKINLPDKSVFFGDEVSFLPRILKKIIDRRVNVKNKLKKEKDKSEMKKLDGESYALKILANSFYGYMGFYGARWYSFDCARSITAYGRKYIENLIKSANKKNISVIYGDTDSIFLIDNEEVDEFIKGVNKDLPDPMELEDEGTYESGIFLEKRNSKSGAKKRYALMNKNGNLTIKGLESKRGDWSKLSKDSQIKILTSVLKTKSIKSAEKIISEIIEKINGNKMSLDNFVLKNKLTRNLDDYKSIGPQVAAGRLMEKENLIVGPGTIVEYVVSNKKSKLIRDKVILAKNAKIEDIDKNYYIEKQLIAATYKIFELFNYKEEQLKNLSSGLSAWM